MHQNGILLYCTIIAAQLITHFQQIMESQQEEQELILQALLLLQRRQNLPPFLAFWCLHKEEKF
jgi:hypothetical protein